MISKTSAKQAQSAKAIALFWICRGHLSLLACLISVQMLFAEPHTQTQRRQWPPDCLTYDSIIPASSNVTLDTNWSSMTNLVIFLRFADDEEITHPFSSIDSMFNGKTPGYPSIYNYYDVSTYGHLHFSTIYADQVSGDNIVSFVDEHPRGYYQPYSANNPIGYHGSNPLIGISMREAELLAAAMDYVDSMGLVDTFANLDGNNGTYTLNSAHFSAATDPTRCTLSVNNLTLGHYIIKVTHLDGTANVVKFVKE